MWINPGSILLSFLTGRDKDHSLQRIQTTAQPQACSWIALKVTAFFVFFREGEGEEVEEKKKKKKTETNEASKT